MLSPKRPRGPYAYTGQDAHQKELFELDVPHVRDESGLDMATIQQGDVDNWDFSILVHLLLYNSV